MPFEFLCPVEQIPVGGKFPADEGLPKGLGDVDHFGVKVADPLHFIVGIEGGRLDDFRQFRDDIGVYSLALEFGDNGEDNPGEVPAGATPPEPYKLQFLEQPEFPVEVLIVLIQFGNIDNGFTD